MSRAEFRVREEGLADARAKLQAMRERAQNLAPAWEATLDWYAKANRAMFRTQGARWGERWEELASRTIADKRRGGYPLNVLIRTGELRDSMTRRPLDVERYDAHGLVAGTSIWYARFHQRGTQRMPARKLIRASAVRAEGAATRAVITWITEGVAQTS